MPNDNAIAIRQPETIQRAETFAPRLPNFEPQNISELELFARIISSSGLAPKDYSGKLENCMVAMMMGRELGLSPIQAVQGIAVVNGRPSVWGDALWALIVSHPEYGGCDEKVTDQEATCILRRITRGRESKVETSFSIADATKAGLLGNAVWKTYPKRMLMWRARTFAARDLFPDALKGISSIEEARDTIIEGEFTPVPSAPVQSLPAQSYTQAPAATTAGSAPAPAADPNITEEQGKAWNKAWEPVFKRAGLEGKEHMKLRADAKREELDRIGIGRTSEMKLSQFEASLRRIADWKPANPTQAATETAIPSTAMTTEDSKASHDPVVTRANENEHADSNFAEPDPDDDLPERTVRGWMNTLGMSMFEQSAKVGRATKDGVTDWGQLAQEILKQHGDALRAKGVEI